MARKESKKVADAARAVAAADPHNGKGAVLIIEADPDLQWRIARALTVQGHRVVGTGSGDGALALMREWPVDLVLIDEGKPTMSGLDVARRIRQEHPEIPVVLMTGESADEVRVAARLAGAVACITKPFHIDALADLLRTDPTPAE